MRNWYETVEERYWLHPDEVGGEEARFIVKVLRLRRGDSVLDAPCGAGRVSIHLARAGLAVTGLDLRNGFVRRARQRFRTAGLRGVFRVLDLRYLEFAAQFSGIFNWAGSFGYFTDAENVALVAAYARALRPGGRLLIEQPEREHLRRHFQREMRTGSVTVRCRWNARDQRVTTRRYESGVERRRNSSSIRLYTPAQMRALFERAGLVVVGIYRSLTFDAYGNSVPRMAIVGRMPLTGARPAKSASPTRGTTS
jgi:SAM-dependent methyltransferase